MDQVTIPPDQDEANALSFAYELGALASVFHPVLRDAAAFWSPDQPPATVLLGSLGRVFAEGFPTLGAAERAKVMGRLEDGMASGSDYLETAIATGFLEALVHKAEDDATWPMMEEALGPLSRGFAGAYRADPFHLPPSPEHSTAIA